MERMTSAFKHISLPVLAQVITVVQQAGNLDWAAMFSSATKDPSGLVLPLSGLLNVDNLAIDRKHGVCPIPLYNLSDDDWAMLSSRDDIASIKTRLEQLGVYQYFFPHGDELALGFVDRHHGRG